MGMERGSTIRIFLVDGTPQGIRLVERPGWTGCLLVVPRSDYVTARLRGEVATTGVYVLIGPDPEGVREQRVYVGEADEVRTRLDTHQQSKDFWTHAYVLATKDRSLNKAHVRYLESRLLSVAREADRAVIDNGTGPGVPPLSEPEVADMETYLDQVLPLFPLAGVDVFDTLEDIPTPVVALPSAHAEPGIRYFLDSILTKAEGRDDARGFTVFEGALGRAETMVMTPSYTALRERLLAEGILERLDAQQVRLTKTTVFDSPSAAASVLTGGSKNGRDVWKDARGRTLKQNQQASVTDS